MVITHVVTPEEFWAQHAAQYTQTKQVPRQEIGVNSAFLVSVECAKNKKMVQLFHFIYSSDVYYFRQISNRKQMAAMD